jgi:AhpD family alkylhydroperoxidase
MHCRLARLPKVGLNATSTSEGLNMPKVYREITRSVSASLAKLRVDTPDVMKGFSALADAAMRDGALDKKTKELIALALGVAGHCDACLGFHLKTLVKLGATRAEVEEALGVAVYMGGGPSLMYAADALAAFEELSAPG